VRRVRKHTAMRVVASFLATVALAGQVTSFAHLVLVRHVTCAEHGELVELGKEHAIPKAPPPKRPSSFVSAESTADGHGHDHCLIAPMRRDRIVAGAPSSLDSFHVDAYGTVGVVAVDEVAPPIAVILLAPKNSPPLA
jgi:hypothetical protein